MLKKCAVRKQTIWRWGHWSVVRALATLAED